MGFSLSCNFFTPPKVFFPDFTEALRLEPGSETTKEELKKVAEFIELDKRKVWS